jgi:serine/threonine protein kinase
LGGPNSAFKPYFSSNIYADALSPQVMGLSYIHDAGIIHRRISPSSLFVDGFGDIRIADFDNAYLDATPHLRPLRPYTDEATAHWLPYVAPEAHADGKSDRSTRYGVAVDYWSLGCVLFELESPLGKVSQVASAYGFGIERIGQAVASDGDFRAYLRSADRYGEVRWPIFRSLGENARSVIAGVRQTSACCKLKVLCSLQLMRVNPYLRFGKEDLYLHFYFDNDDGHVSFIH